MALPNFGEFFPLLFLIRLLSSQSLLQTPNSNDNPPSPLHPQFVPKTAKYVRRTQKMSNIKNPGSWRSCQCRGRVGWSPGAAEKKKGKVFLGTIQFPRYGFSLPFQGNWNQRWAEVLQMTKNFASRHSEFVLCCKGARAEFQFSPLGMLACASGEKNTSTATSSIAIDFIFCAKAFCSFVSLRKRVLPPPPSSRILHWQLVVWGPPLPFISTSNFGHPRSIGYTSCKE